MPFLQGLNEQQNQAVIEKEGTILILSVEPVAENDNGQPNTITTTGWIQIKLVYPEEELHLDNRLHLYLLKEQGIEPS